MNDTRFLRPHYTLAQGSERPTHLPYPREVFDTYDIFEILPLDGGAFFFSQEHLGGTRSECFIHAIEAGSLFAPWMTDNGMQWDKALASAQRAQIKPPWEKHVWLNRLYFLLAIARRYYTTNDAHWARMWLSLFDDWSAKNPYDDISLRTHGRGNYTWFDMQVAWRLFVFTYSVHLLAGSTSLTAAAWERIYRAIGVHTEHLYQESVHDIALDKKIKGNHYLQKGTALLLASILFPEMGDSRAYRNAAIKIYREHDAKETLADGGNIENSPSYSHFIARMYLDAYLICEKNGIADADTARFKASAEKQYAFLARTATPSGSTLQINDSYSLDAARDLALAHAVCPSIADVVRSSTALFLASGRAILMNDHFSIHIDNGPTGLWHHHDARPNIIAFAGKEPFIVDSGCCNYDRSARAWMNAAGAHCVLTLADSNGAMRASGTEHRSFEPTASGGTIVFSTRYQGACSAEWIRTITLSGARLIIDDAIQADGSVTVSWAAPIAGYVQKNKDGSITVLLEQGSSITIDFGADTPLLRDSTAINDRNQPGYIASVDITKQGISFHITVIIDMQ
ncbi:MAG: heparinase II/III family protein [Spirochaetota bacterium]